MRGDYRQFHLYDLELSVRKQGGVPPTMETALSVWQNAKDASMIYPILNGEARMIIGDIERPAGEDYFILLIRVSDTAAPNSVYSNLDTGEFDEHIKEQNTGSDFAVHVIISLTEETRFTNVYTCAIEKVSGLSAEYVRRILSKFLHSEYTDNADSFRYPAAGGGLDRNGNPRLDRALPHVELRGRPSEQFVNDINNGTLSGIKLIRTEEVTPITGAAYLQKETTELRLKIIRNALPARIWESLRFFMLANAEDYERAKITYRLPNVARSVTVEFDAVSGTPINDLYVMCFEIENIFPPLAQSSQRIVQHLKDIAVRNFLEYRAI